MYVSCRDLENKSTSLRRPVVLLRLLRKLLYKWWNQTPVPFDNDIRSWRMKMKKQVDTMEFTTRSTLK